VRRGAVQPAEGVQRGSLLARVPKLLEPAAPVSALGVAAHCFAAAVSPALQRPVLGREPVIMAMLQVTNSGRCIPRRDIKPSALPWLGPRWHFHLGSQATQPAIPAQAPPSSSLSRGDLMQPRA